MHEIIRVGLLALIMATPAFSAVQQQEVQRIVAASSKERGWLGVSITDVSAKKAKEVKLPDTDGALVASVVEGSPAENAGIQEGDIILEFGSRRIYDASDLVKAVGRTDPDAAVAVVVWREMQKKTLSVVVGKPPRSEQKRVRAFSIGPRRIGELFSSSALGMTLRTLTPQLAEYFGAPEKEGVLIEEIRKESAAEKAGLKAGDVIVKFGGKRTDEVRDIQRALSAYDEGESVPVEIIRKGAPKTVTMTIEESEFEFEHRIELPRVPLPRLRFYQHDPDDAFQWLEPDDAEDLELDLKIEMDGLTNKLRDAAKELKRSVLIRI